MAPAKQACACSGTFRGPSFWPKLMIHGGSLIQPTAEVTLPGNNIFWRNSRQVTICSASIPSALGQEDNVFSICRGTGEF